MEDSIRETAAAAALTNTTTTTPNAPTEDPPPKYTPPPSYTTATGARIAKFLRQSIRRSVRRIANVLGESSGSRQQTSEVQNNQTQPSPPPPDYNAVLVEMNRAAVTDSPDRRTQELAIASQSSALTAADVASILRNSFRRSTVRSAFRSRVLNEANTGSMSAENLVDHAVPVGETSLVMEQRSNGEGNDDTIKVDSSSVI